MDSYVVWSTENFHFIIEEGPTFTILTLLASLNSCVNPYIFLFFNPNLLENCFRGIFRPKFPARRFNNGSPLSRTMSQNKKAQFGVAGATSSIGKYSGGGNSSILKGSTRASQLAAVGGSGGGHQNSPNCYTSTPSPSSPLISQEGSGRSPSQQQPPTSNGSERGYLEKLSERSESTGNALELVDSSQVIIISNGSTKQEKYSPVSVRGTQAQPCRVETALVRNKNHVSTSTLIT